MSGGKRYDNLKLRIDLLPPEWVEALSEVTTRGSFKYDDNNWLLGMLWSKVIGPLERHLLSFKQGLRYDRGETGCHHLAMVAWNALALMSYDIRGLGKNDLCNYNFGPPTLSVAETSRAEFKKGVDEWKKAQGIK